MDAVRRTPQYLGEDEDFRTRYDWEKEFSVNPLGYAGLGFHGPATHVIEVLDESILLPISLKYVMVTVLWSSESSLCLSSHN